MWWHDGTGICGFAVENCSKITEICFFSLFFLPTAELKR